jgi:acyl carrier protein
MERSQVTEVIKAYVEQRILRGRTDALTETTSLIALRVIDSMSLIDLVTFLEKEFGISLMAPEIEVRNFDNLQLMTDLVLRSPRK